MNAAAKSAPLLAGVAGLGVLGYGALRYGDTAVPWYNGECYVCALQSVCALHVYAHRCREALVVQACHVLCWCAVVGGQRAVVYNRIFGVDEVVKEEGMHPKVCPTLCTTPCTTNSSTRRTSTSVVTIVDEFHVTSPPPRFCTDALVRSANYL